MANLDKVTKKAAQMAKQKGSKIFMDADSIQMNCWMLFLG